MKYLYIAIVTSIVLFNSCVTTNFVNLEIREPAYISFPPEVTNVLIVDNTPSVKTEAEDETERQSQIEIMSTDSAKSIMLNHLQKFMNEEKYFNSVEIYPYRTNGGTSTNDVIPLSRRNLQAISQEKKADALIVFDLFLASAQLETINTAYFSNYSLLGCKVGALIRVYSDEGKLYTPPMMFLDSLFREETTDWSRLKKNIPEINSLIYEISVVSADKLTSKFIPSWKLQERWYYSDNSSEMKKSAEFAKAGNWKEAADMWGTLFDKESNDKKKMRLASNLALANEYLDDIENAYAWIEIAFGLLPSKNKSELGIQIISYRDTLRKRQENKSKLFEQLGIEDTHEEQEEP